MPNRIIKESICISETIDSLTWMEEVFFYRLIVNCDDYGRLDARPAILKAKLFPLKDITQKQISETLNKLTMAGMVMVYEYDQRPYLQLVSWSKHQQIRNKKSKFPSPDETCNQLISDDSNSPRNPIQSESNPNPNPNPNPNTNTNDTAAVADDENNPAIFYKQNIGPLLPMVGESITQYSKDLPDELLTQAMRIAVLQNKRSLKYIEQIWIRWIDAGIKTIDDYNRSEAEWEAKKSRAAPGSNATGLNKKLDFNKFPQHDITNDQLDNLFEKIGG